MYSDFCVALRAVRVSAFSRSLSHSRGGIVMTCLISSGHASRAPAYAWPRLASELAVCGLYLTVPGDHSVQVAVSSVT